MFQPFDTPSARSFLIDGGGEDNIRPLPLILPLYFNPLAPGQEQLRVLLIICSTPKGVGQNLLRM